MTAPSGDRSFPFPRGEDDYNKLTAAQKAELDKAFQEGASAPGHQGPGWPGGLNSDQMVTLGVIKGAIPLAGGPAAGVVDTVASITEGLAKGAAWLSNRHNWLRVLYFTVGVGLVWSGAVILFRRPLAAGAKVRLTPAK